MRLHKRRGVRLLLSECERSGGRGAALVWEGEMRRGRERRRRGGYILLGTHKVSKSGVEPTRGKTQVGNYLKFELS